MADKTVHYDTNGSDYFQIIRHNITPLDLFIISKLNEGCSLEDVAKAAEKELNIKNAKNIIKERLKKLQSEDRPEEKILLQSYPQYVTNPAKLYHTIALIFIKANLDGPERKQLDISIQNVFETIVNLNNKPQFGKPIKQLFTIPGWMFDFFGIVYVNNIERFHSFREHLINEGIARSVDIVPVDTEKGFLFNPLSSPDYHNFKQFLVHYHERMNIMVDELKTNDVNSTKTTRFFNKEDYGLQMISGKNKGELYPIDVTELKIGRYHDNDIIIQDIAVSRRHAKISHIGHQYLFKDQSTNGSYVNNNQIINDEVELKEGDIIKIGKNELKFQKLCIDKK